MTVTCNETTQQMDIDSEEDDIQNEFVKEVENFKNRTKSNLDETEIVNLGDVENVKETRNNIHLAPSEKKEYTEFLREYEDIFAWSYDDMTGLSTSIVAHKLPTDLTCPPVKQKLRKFKPDMSLKIKEQITKQVKAKVLRVVKYPIWLANIVLVPKKYGKMLKKDAATKWTDDCQKAFDRIKEYLSIALVLVPPEPGEDIVKSYEGWRMFLDGAANFKGVSIGAVLVSETSQHYPVSAKLRLADTSGPRRMGDQELQDTSLSASCIGVEKEDNKNRIPASYCAHVEEEADGKPWFYDIKEYLAIGEYLELANTTQKRTLRRLSNNFFHGGGIQYRRTPDLGLLRCVDAKEAFKLLEEIHVGTCGPHMNGFVLAKKILRAGYFWMTMETDCIQYIRKCHCCQILADMIKVPPNELTATSSSWSFTAWGMDIIGPIEPATSNAHRFILVTIDYFTKWVEETSYIAVTKKVVAYFVRDRIKMKNEDPNFGMVSIPSLFLEWWRSLPSNDQINEWKERDAKSSEKLEYLEYSLLELKGKVRKRVTAARTPRETKENSWQRNFTGKPMRIGGSDQREHST
ncbi:uncharacterized protein [Nicotiana sylvestris]|uniref:uncharacterized protein n=1 Tax=Nicotiana sylvestris TaxID=4096 RepID=UPI00388CBDF3